MQNHAKIGGILSIVAGAFGLLWLLFFLLMAVIISFAVTYNSGFGEPFYDGPDMVARNIILVIYGLMGFGYALVGALGIVGGIFALKRRYWGWSLAGAIAGAFTFFPVGVAAIIFVSLGRPEFQGRAAPAGEYEIRGD